MLGGEGLLGLPYWSCAVFSAERLATAAAVVVVIVVVATAERQRKDWQGRSDCAAMRLSGGLERFMEFV